MNDSGRRPRKVHLTEQPVAGNFVDTDGVISGSLPETDALEALHIGPYDTLENTYHVILGQMEAEGLTPADNMWEYYLSGPEEEPDPEKWQTRVIWPLA